MTPEAQLLDRERLRVIDDVLTYYSERDVKVIRAVLRSHPKRPTFTIPARRFDISGQRARDIFYRFCRHARVALERYDRTSLRPFIKPARRRRVTVTQLQYRAQMSRLRARISDLEARLSGRGK